MTAHPVGSARPGEALAAFLLGRGEPPPPELLRASRLAALAYALLPEDHPRRPGLRPDYLGALGRHLEIRSEILPLLRAWSAAGVEALPFKGFHLAEFVYPAPGARFYADVDLRIPPEQERPAEGVARELGWRVLPNPDGPLARYGHCAFQLYRPGGASRIDVHRHLLHAHLPLQRAPRRITSLVWEAARARDWEGARIRELEPIDALLVGLVAQRCWSRDRWCPKPHDAVDFRLLSERGGFGREALRERARELGCPRTLEIFLRRCDPEAGVLDLRRPTRARRWGMSAAVAGERLPRPVEIAANRLVRLPGFAVDLARAVPVLLRVRRALRRSRGLPRILRSLTPASRPAGEPSPGRRVGTARGIQWLIRLVHPDPARACVLRSLALYAELSRQGWPVVFVSGVRRDPSGVVGHAWIEIDGIVPPEAREASGPSAYSPIFRFPDAGEEEAGGVTPAAAGAGAGPPAGPPGAGERRPPLPRP